MVQNAKVRNLTVHPWGRSQERRVRRNCQGLAPRTPCSKNASVGYRAFLPVPGAKGTDDRASGTKAPSRQSNAKCRNEVGSKR